MLYGVLGIHLAVCYFMDHSYLLLAKATKTAAKTVALVLGHMDSLDNSCSSRCFEVAFSL